MQAPILEDLAKQYTADQLKIVKVNVDEERELAMAYGINRFRPCSSIKTAKWSIKRSASATRH